MAIHLKPKVDVYSVCHIYIDIVSIIIYIYQFFVIIQHIYKCIVCILTYPHQSLIPGGYHDGVSARPELLRQDAVGTMPATVVIGAWKISRKPRTNR
jgi:hypothetical protein